MTSRFLSACFGATLLLVAGCSSGPKQQESTKYTLANTDRFVVLDSPALYAISCTGLQERVLEDGKLEVIANVRNRENRPLQLQVQCVFKDAQGFPSGDESPFEPLVLPEYATQTVRFTSTSTASRNYTIRVRQPREPGQRPVN